VAKLRAAGAHTFGVPLDVTDDGSAKTAARLIEERAGRLGVLVNNADVAGGLAGPAHDSHSALPGKARQSRSGSRPSPTTARLASSSTPTDPYPGDRSSARPR
jgi:NAD(P)-dependent dehydrogenase (short-subunit alcohol dehydrogenase family)